MTKNESIHESIEIVEVETRDEQQLLNELKHWRDFKLWLGSQIVGLYFIRLLLQYEQKIGESIDISDAALNYVIVSNIELKKLKANDNIILAQDNIFSLLEKKDYYELIESYLF